MHRRYATTDRTSLRSQRQFLSLPPPSNDSHCLCLISIKLSTDLINVGGWPSLVLRARAHSHTQIKRLFINLLIHFSVIQFRVLFQYICHCTLFSQLYRQCSGNVSCLPRVSVCNYVKLNIRKYVMDSLIIFLFI